MGRILTYSELAADTRARLQTHYPPGEANAMTRIIFERLKGYTPADLVLKGAQEAGEYIIGKTDNIVKRLLADEPIQYIFGIADFYGMEFKVTPDVLIPRPETAELVDIIVSDWKNKPDLEIADLCTGSGCIACALARNLPFSAVTAIDISAPAIAVAQENATALKTKINFIKADVLTLAPSAGKYDIIVSNPPYITEKEKAAMEPNVLEHEPALALFVPDNEPLRFYKPITVFASESLKPGGMLYFEINPEYASDIQKLISGYSFSEIEVIRDSAARKRFIKATHE
ncbi:MAG: peptide chain release factor N(5)-glutamine methyltransferase [Paramuribaculum sp.]|nr:peptide chain release factor N(5)-glutamine methyltransferase [Paramuribaculum sp.]